MILLDVKIVSPGSAINAKLGNPVPFKAGQPSVQNNNTDKTQPPPQQQGACTFTKASESLIMFIALF